MVFVLVFPTFLPPSYRVSNAEKNVCDRRNWKLCRALLLNMLASNPNGHSIFRSSYRHDSYGKRRKHSKSKVSKKHVSNRICHFLFTYIFHKIWDNHSVCKLHFYNFFVCFLLTIEFLLWVANYISTPLKFHESIKGTFEGSLCIEIEERKRGKLRKKASQRNERISKVNLFWSSRRFWAAFRVAISTTF